MEVQNYYDIIKITKGSLALKMPSYDSSLPDRVVRLSSKTKQLRIPRTFALGIMVDPVLEQMYIDGYFTIVPEDKFKADIEGVFSVAPKATETMDDNKIVTALKQGNRVAIKQFIEKSPVLSEQVIVLARENIGNLTSSMIDFLNQLLGVELQIDGE